MQVANDDLAYFLQCNESLNPYRKDIATWQLEIAQAQEASQQLRDWTHTKPSNMTSAILRTCDAVDGLANDGYVWMLNSCLDVWLIGSLAHLARCPTSSIALDDINCTFYQADIVQLFDDSCKSTLTLLASSVGCYLLTTLTLCLLALVALVAWPSLTSPRKTRRPPAYAERISVQDQDRVPLIQPPVLSSAMRVFGVSD